MRHFYDQVMNCLKRLSISHKMSIITSIHQPNNEIVLMFDKVYVLAKGGHCVYSGSPDLIPYYLSNCYIIMNEYQVPIEQLLKLASIEAQEEYFSELINTTRSKIKDEVSLDQLEPTLTGLQFRSKSFSPLDTFYLIERNISEKYIKQWKTLFLRFVSYILFAFCICNMFDENIGGPSSCFNTKTFSNDSCVKELEGNTLLIKNQNFLFFTIILAQVIETCFSTIAYLNDIQIFVNEHDNGNNNLKFNNLLIVPYS